MPPTKPTMWITARTDAEYYRALDKQYELQGLMCVIVQDHRHLKGAKPENKGGDSLDG